MRMRTNRAKGEVECCGKFFLISAFAFLPPPSLLAPALQSIYRMMGLGAIIGEEFFKATYYGIPRAEQQVIRFLKKEFIIQGFIYILFCLIFSKRAARKDNPVCQV